MNINAVSQTVFAPLASIKKLMDTQPANTNTSSTDSTNLSTSSTISNIMKNYDLSNISQNEINSLCKKLYDAGAITGEQMLDLTAPSYHVKMDMNFNVIDTSNDKRDFIGELNSMLEYAKQHRSDDKSTIAHLQNTLNLVQNLQATTHTPSKKS